MFFNPGGAKMIIIVRTSVTENIALGIAFGQTVEDTITDSRVIYKSVFKQAGHYIGPVAISSERHCSYER